jgi:hypothetical protein
MKTISVGLEFQEGLLGTVSGDKELAKEFIASKHPEEIQQDELDAIADLDEEVEKSSTLFAKEDGQPHLWDYQIKGFFKDACGMLRRVPGTSSSKIKAYKKVIDGLIFPRPRKIFINLNGELTWNERPIRVNTPQGERVALVRSEEAPAGSTINFDIVMLDDRLLDTVIDWLEYGEFRGLGQWRNSGMGRFTYALL